MLIGKKEEFRMKELLSEAVMVLCKATLTYRTHLNIQGLIGITIDDQEIFLVNINESLHKGNEDSSVTDMQKTSLNSSKDDFSASSSDEEPTPEKTPRKRSPPPELSSRQSIKTKQVKLECIPEKRRLSEEFDSDFDKKPVPLIQSKPTPIMVKKEKPIKVEREENGPSHNSFSQNRFQNPDILGSKLYISDDSEDGNPSGMMGSTLGFGKQSEVLRDLIETPPATGLGATSALDAVVKRLKEQSKTVTNAPPVISDTLPIDAPGMPAASKWPNQFLPASQLLGSMNAPYTEQSQERSLTPEGNSNFSDSDSSTGQSMLSVAMTPNQSQFEATSPSPSKSGSGHKQQPIIHVPNLMQATAPIDNTRHPKAWAGGCQCKLCGKRFPSPSALEKHLRIHTGEKPFKCPVCGRGFSQEGNMRRHHMRHAAELRKTLEFKCYLCEVDFPDSDILLHHLSLVHDIQQPDFKLNFELSQVNATNTSNQAAPETSEAFAPAVSGDGFNSTISKPTDGFGLATSSAADGFGPTTTPSKPSTGMTLGPHLVIQADEPSPKPSSSPSQVTQVFSDAN